MRLVALEQMILSEQSVVALREKAVYIGLGIPIFIPITGVAEKTFVTKKFQKADNIDYPPTYMKP